MRISDWSSDVCSSDLSGSVLVDGETIGQLDGFRFSVASDARHADQKMLLAAAERRLGGILGQRADDLVAAPDKDFALVAEEGQAPGIRWRQTPVAMLCAGTGLLQPDIRLDAGILALPSEQQRAIGRRLTDWLDAQKQRHLRPLLAMAQHSRDPTIAPPLRAVLAPLAAAGRILPPNIHHDALTHPDKQAIQHLSTRGMPTVLPDFFLPNIYYHTA